MGRKRTSLGAADVSGVEPSMLLVRRLFQQTGMSYRVLGEFLGTTAQGAHRLLRAKDMRVALLRKAAKALGVTAERLLRG